MAGGAAATAGALGYDKLSRNDQPAQDVNTSTDDPQTFTGKASNAAGDAQGTVSDVGNQAADRTTGTFRSVSQMCA